MQKLVASALLITGLVLPIVLFWLLRSQAKLNSFAVVAIAVATGWAFNVAWALTSQGSTTNDSSQVGEDMLSMAIRFGWFCPTVVVLLTWLVWYLKSRFAG